ncbi:MAG: TetR/AcrR family transcriptional regulator [Deferrisomatales bacterium]|nr:TetR/AcrR family transcriptional regulator [Deferrisomatales bacterium]
MPPPPRPNLKDERAQATRRKILVAATELFARRGYHKTSTADLAATIGMTQGAVFHHFASKEALLHAVLERLARGLEAYRALLEGPASAGSVHRVVDLMVEHFKRQPEATICLAALATEFAGSGDPVLETIRRIYDSFVVPFEEVLARHPRVSSPRVAAVSFIGAVQGIAIQGLLREGNPSIDVLARGFLEMLGDW